MLRAANHWAGQTSLRDLCMAGGVAPGCVASEKLLGSGIIDDIWIQPAAGGALGAAPAVWHRHPASRLCAALPHTSPDT